jgi:hypothetical protein
MKVGASNLIARLAVGMTAQKADLFSLWVAMWKPNGYGRGSFRSRESH